MERLIQNVDDIKIKLDTSEIERMLQELLVSLETNNSRLQEFFQHMGQQISKAKLVPKVQLWIHYSI
ncbi:DUF6730 family protein [Maribacter sp. ACAM166]|uniref:DUF6730 family protein n=1 Tax=Maribacter sp. ACAM166 TaxID=2508996 RepID=UPI0010FD1818|nr:DUF6730 family protein [Maribacter sp. ACAM166]TLP74167.1 hypothetical protein ES765_16675 [Maribacter sp. ACAM166]